MRIADVIMNNNIYTSDLIKEAKLLKEEVKSIEQNKQNELKELKGLKELKEQNELIRVKNIKDTTKEDKEKDIDMNKLNSEFEEIKYKFSELSEYIIKVINISYTS